jgi:hypothetical protein
MQGLGKSGEGVWYSCGRVFLGGYTKVAQKLDDWQKRWVKLMQGFGFPENGISREGSPRVHQEFTFLGGGLPSEDVANHRWLHHCASHRQHYHPAAQQRPWTFGKEGRFQKFIPPCCGGCGNWRAKRTDSKGP